MVFKAASLPRSILAIVQNKGTERPFSGEYDTHDAPGTYLCRLCGLALFRAHAKFHSGCGWPSFDEAIADNIVAQEDSDGKRSEILCARCHAHLGHVFSGENFTSKNTRHCVNSLSIDFIHDKTVSDTQEAIFAAGCFWGVEYYFAQLPGVLKTEVGYCGGEVEDPTYEQVCRGNTGHVEAIRVVYDPNVISYKALVQFFFEIHNQAQSDGQGPDRGPQYLSVAFYYEPMQQDIIIDRIEYLKKQGFSVATQVLPVQPFYKAEAYHQDYYAKTGKAPYCHFYEKKF